MHSIFLCQGSKGVIGEKGDIGLKGDTTCELLMNILLQTQIEMFVYLATHSNGNVFVTPVVYM